MSQQADGDLEDVHPQVLARSADCPAWVAERKERLRKMLQSQTTQPQQAKVDVLPRDSVVELLRKRPRSDVKTEEDDDAMSTPSQAPPPKPQTSGATFLPPELRAKLAQALARSDK